MPSTAILALLPRPRAVWAHLTRRCGRRMPFKRTLRARQRRTARLFVRGGDTWLT